MQTLTEIRQEEQARRAAARRYEDALHERTSARHTIEKAEPMIAAAKATLATLDRLVELAATLPPVMPVALGASACGLAVQSFESQSGRDVIMGCCRSAAGPVSRLVEQLEAQLARARDALKAATATIEELES